MALLPSLQYNFVVFNENVIVGCVVDNQIRDLLIGKQFKADDIGLFDLLHAEHAILDISIVAFIP